MHTLAEVRRDVSAHQNRGGGDGVPGGTPGPPLGPYAGPHHANLPHLSCRTPPNYAHNDRSDIVRQLWRQQMTAPCIHQRLTGNIHQVVPSGPQQYGVMAHFGFYGNVPEGSGFSRQPPVLNNSLHVEPGRRNFVPADNHVMAQPPKGPNPTPYINYASSNVITSGTNYPPPGNSTVLPSYLSITQFNYQNVPPPMRSGPTNIPAPPANMNYTPVPPPPPPPLPPHQLVFGPPPRDRRSTIPIDENRTASFHDVPTTAAYADSIVNPPQSMPMYSVFQNYGPAIKLTGIEKDDPNITNRVLNGQRTGQPNATTSNNSIGSENTLPTPNRSIPNTPDTNPSFTGMPPSKTAFSEAAALEVSHYSEFGNGTDAQSDGTIQTQSARTNIKLKFSKNVVNIPKKIETHDDRRSGDPSSFSDSGKTCLSDLSRVCNMANENIKHSPPTSNEDMFSWPLKDTQIIYRTSDSKAYPHELEDTNDSFILQEENSFIDMVVEGCIHGEDIATKYQNIPCFKNIKKLCEKTKNDLMTPHCTARNIHSQGIPWATKDYIFAFTRVTSCWYLLKGYLGHKSDVFEKIEQLYSPGLRKSFEIWENSTADLSFHLMKSFMALGNNSSTKWNPRVHSTPLHTGKIIVPSPMPPIMPIDFNESTMDEKYNTKKTAELQILSRNTNSFNDGMSPDVRPSNIDLVPRDRDDQFCKSNRMDMKRLPTDNFIYFNKVNNQRVSKEFPNHVFKPIAQGSPRYDFDSGDESTSKKYIKPGCYAVPQLRNPTPPVISPRPFNDVEDIPIAKHSPPKKPMKMSPIIILSHLNDASMGQSFKTAKTPETASGVKIISHVYPRDHKDIMEHVPFKNTPQGMITSALMKRSREDFPKPPVLNEDGNVSHQCTTPPNSSGFNGKITPSDSISSSEDSKAPLFDSLDQTSKSSSSYSTHPNLLEALENVSNSNHEFFPNGQLRNGTGDVGNIINCKLTVERRVEIDDHIECVDSQACEIGNCEDQRKARKSYMNGNINGYRAKMNPSKVFGSKRQYRNIESKASIRKGIVVTTRRRSEISAECQTKRTAIKKCHRSYYNTVLSANTKTNDESLRPPPYGKHKCRQNVEWSMWYSKLHEGLSRLAVQTFERILNELWNMPSSHYFAFEVDVRDVPDYYQIVKHPMFLTNILQKLKEFKYNSLNQVVQDFRRIFINARLFLEVHPDKRLHRLISHFSNAFEQLLEDNFPRMDFNSITEEPNEMRYDSMTLERSLDSPAVPRKPSSRSSTPSKSDTSPSSQEDR